MSPGPQLILLSDRILTMDPTVEPMDGIVVRDGRIDGFVARADVEAVRGEWTEVVDVGARPVMPGFVDPHAHAEDVSREEFGAVDCRAPGCRSIADVLDVLRDRAADTDPGEWIVGLGNLFYDRKLSDGRFPSRAELDAVSRRHPIVIQAGGHVSLLNSAALERSGIDRDYRPPSRSTSGVPVIDRDGGGEPTGVVKEMDSLLPLPRLGPAEVEAAMDRTLRTRFAAHGVTTVGEISGTLDGIAAMGRLADAGRLPLRMRVYLWAPGTIAFADALDWRRHVSLGGTRDRLDVVGLKLFADGGFSARNAAVKCPYHGTADERGTVALDDAFLAQAVSDAREAGLQLAIHANGDRAQEWVCEAIARHGGGGGRVRVEHAGNFLPDAETERWWRRAGVIPVPQPVFLYNFGDYFADYLGRYGERGRFPFRSLLDAGWRLSGSSDVWFGAETEQARPFFSIWCCLARTSFAGNVIDAHEAVTLDEALRMHTIDAAWVLGEDDVKGSITPGKLADLIVLERDPYTAPVEDLRGLRVQQTYLAGERIAIPA